ncbi:MAG: hypothetical protein JW776_11350 [Candidatus Lokiarchaeota archaeon]|nr:hypothetical protein [Candidatus Lokiarchaeota archaeon]
MVLLLFFLGERPSKIAAIVILSLTIVGLILQIVLSLLQLRNFKTYLESYNRIDDVSIARGLHNELVTVRRQLYEMMKEEKCPGMIILLKNTYIYYNSKMVDSLRTIYEQDKDNFNETVHKLLSKQGDLYKNEIQEIRKQLEGKSSKTREKD